MTDSTKWEKAQAGQGRSLCGGPAAALLFNQQDENCHSCQSGGVYQEKDKEKKEKNKEGELCNL